MKDKILLVTGADSFIGPHLIKITPKSIKLESNLNIILLATGVEWKMLSANIKLALFTLLLDKKILYII